jgi:hypothetical protein
MCERCFGDEIVGEPVGELRQSVRGQRRDDEQIGSCQVRVEIVAWSPASKSEERLSTDETLGSRGDERDNLVAGLDEQTDELARLVSGDPTGYADEDPSHA